MKTEVSATALLSIAVTLLTMGVSFIREGNVSTGVICIILAIALIFLTVILIEKGVIEKMLSGFQDKKIDESWSANYLTPNYYTPVNSCFCEWSVTEYE